MASAWGKEDWTKATEQVPAVIQVRSRTITVEMERRKVWISTAVYSVLAVCQA